jgi:TolB protein
MRKILFLLAAAVFFAAGISAFAQSAASGGIVVTADTKNANPTLVFNGGLSDQALNAKLLSDFKCCGWFTVLNSGKAAYHVSAKGSLQDFTVTVTNSAGVAMITPFRITDSKDVDAAAHTAVDTILNRLFGIPGICRSKIVFSAYTSAKNRDIFICDFDGSNIKQLTKGNTLCIQPVWAPDGKSFVYIYYNNASTALMQYNMELGLSRRLARSAGGAISPDGKTLAWTDNVDLFTRPVEGGSSPKRITGGKPADTSPRWSPDGKKLCFVSDMKGGRPLIYVIDPFAGGKGTEISGLVGSERTAPSWSADNKLAYCARIGRNYELRVAKLSADGRSAVMEPLGVPGKDTFPGEDPSWAPDNRHVTLTVGNEIYVIDTRLGEKRRLVSGAREIGQSSWSPILK